MDVLKNIKKNTDLKTCSPSIRKGIEWLENELKYDDEKIQIEIENAKQIENEENRKRRIEALEWRFKQKFSPYDAQEFYILDRANRPLVNEYLNCANTKDFWDEEFYEIAHEPLTLYYLSKLGLKNNKFFKKCYNELVDDQRHTGRFGIDQAHYLRTLIEIDKNSYHTLLAEEYYLKEDYSTDSFFAGVNFFDAILGLIEYDFYNTIKKCENDINNAIEFRIHLAKETYNDVGFTDMRLISYILQILTKLSGVYDKRVIEIIKMVKKQQNKDGSWGPFPEAKHTTTSDALLGLIETGEGPKIPLQSFEFELNNLIREYEFLKPKFIHTSPSFKEEIYVKQIQPTILKLILNTDSIIRISAPYIELFNDVLINKYKSDNIELRILTRQPDSNRIKKIVNDLNKITKGMVKFEPKLHSRIIIRDDIEMLVSSADLNSDSLTN